MKKRPAFFLCVLVLLVHSIALADYDGPKLRVGLAVDQFSAQVSSAGKIKVVDGSGRTTVLAPGSHYVSVKQGSLYADQKKLAGSTASLLAADPKNPVLVNQKKYRGALTVLLNSGKKNLNVVNTLPVEQYLYGVVAKEVLPLWPDEAIKAQAVAARSFALYAIDNPKYDNFDIRANEMGQVYGGILAENANTTKLVDATRGMAALYDGAPIQAVFHSSGGGYTEAASAVWGKDIPYLQAVKDYDQDSPRYHCCGPHPTAKGRSQRAGKHGGRRCPAGGRKWRGAPHRLPQGQGRKQRGRRRQHGGRLCGWLDADPELFLCTAFGHRLRQCNGVQPWPCHQRKNRRTDEGNLTLCDGEGCSYTGREKNHAYYGIIHRAVHRTG